MLENCNETSDVRNCQCVDSLNLNTLSVLKLDSSGQIALLLSDGEVVGSIDIFLHYFSFACLSVDLVFVTLHLVALFLNPRTKTLPEKNVASFCLSIIVTHGLFLIGLAFRGYVCKFTSVVAYYGLMSAYFWMLTMSFDVWRSMRAAGKLRLNEEGEHTRFIVYSVCSWSAAGICTIIPVSVGMLPEGYVLEEFRPDIARFACELKDSYALECYANCIQAIVITLNLVLFMDTFRFISKETHGRGLNKSMFMSTPNSKYRKHDNIAKITKDTVLNTRRFICLTLQSGLAWIIVIVICFVSQEFRFDRKVFWYVAIILASLQGFFIFCLFTCKKEILSAVINRVNSERRPSCRQRKNAQAIQSCGYVTAAKKGAAAC